MVFLSKLSWLCVNFALKVTFFTNLRQYLFLLSQLPSKDAQTDNNPVSPRWCCGWGCRGNDTKRGGKGGAGKLLTSVNCRCWRLFKKNKNQTNLKNAHFRRSGTQNNSYLKQFLFLIVHVLRVVCLCCERKCPHNATKWMLAARQVRTETAAGVSRWRMFNRNQKNVWLLNWRSHPLTSSALTGGMREHDAF